eukprot:2880572-Pyramimonas_sp.AAC.1
MGMGECCPFVNNSQTFPVMPVPLPEGVWGPRPSRAGRHCGIARGDRQAAPEALAWPGVMMFQLALT